MSLILLKVINDVPVSSIDASATPVQTRAQVRQIVDRTAQLVELGRAVRDDEIVILEDYAYPAYGVPSKKTSEAIRLAARTEAMITDPVYEGKSLQGMIDLVKKGFFPDGSKVLYVHLGGAPALRTDIAILIETGDASYAKQTPSARFIAHRFLAYRFGE